MKSTSAEIDDAVRRFQDGEFSSLSAYEAATGVKRQTISARLAGGKAHNEAHDSQLKMPRVIEKELVK